MSGKRQKRKLMRIVPQPMTPERMEIEIVIEVGYQRMDPREPQEKR